MIRYRIASSLGPQYMIPQPVKDRAAAEEFMAGHRKYLGGLPGSDTVRIEWRDDIKPGPWNHFDPWSES